MLVKIGVAQPHGGVRRKLLGRAVDDDSTIVCTTQGPLAAQPDPLRESATGALRAEAGGTCCVRLLAPRQHPTRVA